MLKFGILPCGKTIKHRKRRTHFPCGETVISMEEKTNVHAGHRQRVRDMFLGNGFDGFSDHQILEMILYYAYARIDTNEMAHNLIERFGSICGVFDADIPDLCDVGGISRNAAVLIKMFPSAMARYHSVHMESEVYDNTEKICDLFKSCFAGESGEHFYMATFDSGLHLVSNNHICIGGPSSADANIRRMNQIVIRTNTSLIALGHNHLDGSVEPSDTDIISTRYIGAFFASFGVRMLDHIIVGKDSQLSMRRRGILLC